MTQKDLLESVLSELKHIKTHMPNGELKQIQKDFTEIKDDISELKYMLLNPEDGVIVNTNKNTEYRRELQSNSKEYEASMRELDELKRWKQGVNRALWIIFGILASVIIRILMMHSEQL